MQIAVLSDIHGNHTALERCLEHSFSRGIDNFILLGDYVAEFPYPEKTMDLLYSLSEQYTCWFVRGNKEDYWLDRRFNDKCEWKDGDKTVGAMKYTYAHLTEMDLEFYRTLPVTQEIRFDGMPALLVCHGSPRRNNEKMLPDDNRTLQIIKECKQDYILCGHTHLQGVITSGGKTVLNPGAVGVPLRAEGLTQFMILRSDGGKWAHEFVSLDYDREGVVNEIDSSDLMEQAPYWSAVTKHLILTGEVSHASVLARARALCEQENGCSKWCCIPAKYWETAIEEMLG